MSKNSRFGCNCIKLFKNNNIKINNKDIYISYNFTCSIKCKPEKPIPILNEKSMLFIEFPNIILIEIDLIGLLYYQNKLPIYTFEKGEIINPILAIDNKFKLDIDQKFIKIFGLDINIIDNIDDNDIVNIVNDIDNLPLYLLRCMMKLYLT